MGYFIHAQKIGLHRRYSITLLQGAADCAEHRQAAKI
jgi:hypothetical protein